MIQKANICLNELIIPNDKLKQANFISDCARINVLPWVRSEVKDIILHGWSGLQKEQTKAAVLFRS